MCTQILTNKHGCRYPQRNCTAPTSAAEHLQKVPGKVIQSGNNKVKHSKTCIKQKQFGHYYKKRGSTTTLKVKRGTVLCNFRLFNGMPSQRMSKMLERSRISVTSVAAALSFSNSQPDSQSYLKFLQIQHYKTG